MVIFFSLLVMTHNGVPYGGPALPVDEARRRQPARTSHGSRRKSALASARALNAFAARGPT